MEKLKICFVSSEISPFAKTGGLADVSGALGKYLSKLGHDVRLVMPFYSSVNTIKYSFHAVDFAQNIELWFGKRKYIFNILTTKLPGSNADVYFIHCPELYDRWSIYTNDADEHIRFALLSRVAVGLCQEMKWAPDIIHCNDWQTGLVPVYLKTIFNWDKLFHKTKTVLTIHNIGYQGAFKGHIINDLNLSEYYKWFDSEELYFNRINFLRTGVLHADKITTVSKTYAREIQTDYLGEGLQKLLRLRSKDLTGILNGVDYDEWNPETDEHIPYNYSIKNLSGKEKNKKELLKRMGLVYDPEAPVFGMVTRLAEQKGIELFNGCLDQFLSVNNIRFVILGSGDLDYEEFLFHLQLKHKDKLVFYNGYNNELSHLIEAGIDIFVMPSRYEPCGLNQIYSLKYGTVPVVRKTGGLADTVELYKWETLEGAGFVFEHYNSESLLWALNYAITTFKHKDAWKKLMINGMKKDFSWRKQIKKYVNLYLDLINS